MCIICVEFEKERLTLREAAANYREVEATLDPNHSYDLFEELWNQAIANGDYDAMKALTNLPATPLMEFLKKQQASSPAPAPVSTPNTDPHDEYWSQWDENDYFGTD